MNSSQNFEASLLSKLQKLVAGEVISDPYHCSLYSTDASLYQIQPRGVLLPKSAQDVTAAVGWAAEHGVPLVPRGGGTSLSGQSVGAGLVIDFSKYMNQILEINPAERTARVQPGWCWINSAPPSSLTSCCLGQMSPRAAGRTWGA